MRLQIFSVYDKAVQAFLQPFYSRSKGEAIRSFGEAVNDKEHPFAKHAADYSLMQLGEFDDQSGIFHTADPVRVISALESLTDDPFTEDTKIKTLRPLPM